MTTEKIPEVNLEIYSGFLRIAAEDVVYNITVLETHESGVAKVVDKIIDAERQDDDFVPEPQVAEMAEDTQELPDDPGCDEFYKSVSNNLYNDIGSLAKNLTSTIMDLPAEDRRTKRADLDDADEKIEDAKSELRNIVKMTEKATMEIMDHVENVQGQTRDVKNLLALLKDHSAFQKPVESELKKALEESSVVAKVDELKKTVVKAQKIISAIHEEAGAAPEQPTEPQVKTEKRTRFLFPLDVIFQTLYELCTNETVKTHITTARAKAEEIFNSDVFYDSVSPKIAELNPDEDNFYQVPMTDLFTSLGDACGDKGTINLLKKMDSGQNSIFLDMSLPLEVPPTEEVEIEVPSDKAEAPPAPSATKPDPRIDNLSKILEESLALIDDMSTITAESEPLAKLDTQSLMTIEDQAEIFEKIEKSFGIADSIQSVVTKITQALSFQDLSGQRILKIIKLLTDFQIQLVAMVVSFGSQLKHKKQNKSITIEESKALAQKDVDSYIDTMTGAGDEEERELDQSAVNQMLENLGF
ncbi:MAG: protein phosphatase CheZ [Thermodesulfobacteriota bacterium]|nr:protein phosphatase CheZ [Thermodesulfobacteriota bacterium]